MLVALVVKSFPLLILRSDDSVWIQTRVNNLGKNSDKRLLYMLLIMLTKHDNFGSHLDLIMHYTHKINSTLLVIYNYELNWNQSEKSKD